MNCILLHMLKLQCIRLSTGKVIFWVSLFLVAVFIFAKYISERNIDDSVPPERILEIRRANKNRFNCSFLNKEKYGHSMPKQKFVVLAASTPLVDDEIGLRGDKRFNYAFYLPLTALSWQRLGFASIILITGNPDKWSQRPVLKFVLETLKSSQINATIIFLPCSIREQTGLAQLARLFVADMAPFSTMDEDSYLVTSDADLFPIQNIYELEEPWQNMRLATPNDVLHYFDHRDTKHIELIAISCIGMRVPTWRKVMGFVEASKSDNVVENIKKAARLEFGHFPDPEMDFFDWFMDQHFISYKVLKHRQSSLDNECRISQMLQQHYRWDRTMWPNHIDSKFWFVKHDAHCPSPGYTWEAFMYLYELAQLLAGNHFDVVSYWFQFVKKFGVNSTAYPETFEQVKLELSKVQQSVSNDLLFVHNARIINK